MLVQLLFAGSAHALNVKALYTAACKRNLGVILNVSDTDISFLSFKNGVIKIPRYEIIYMADYPMDTLPTPKGLKISQVPMVKIKTLVNHQERLLLNGWPIGFNAEKIGFLVKNGGETVIDARNIWSVEFVPGKYAIQSRRSPNNYRFIHPYSFRRCAYKGSKQSRKIFPQQILSDPVQIKRELDGLQVGFDRVRRYEREQDFYPVPEVYKNQTELGMWFSFGSRHGASEKRNNNFLPVLVDQYSSDIFDFQHYSVSGSAPLFIGTHEEPQSQISYMFKASYFHFSAMIDPNIVLVGENYEFQNIDFEVGTANVRHNDISIVELGFDFGNFAIRAYGGSAINYGIWDGQNLTFGLASVPRFGIKYANDRWWLEVNGGSGSDDLGADSVGIDQGKAEFTISRANFGIEDIAGKFDFAFSFISRSVKTEKKSNLNSDSTTYAGYLYYPWGKRIRLGAFASMEALSVTSNVNDSDDTFFKGGASVFVNF